MLKTVKVSSVHKKDSKLDLVNYHPISLSSNIETFSERLICNRIYKFLSDNNLIYFLQFGFRQNLSLTECIRKNLDEDNTGCGIFVDLQKTFDISEHVILLSKLEHYGVGGLATE